MSVRRVSAVAILDSSVNCVCVWSTEKLTMLAYCVAANCNNSQTTPGITMHELPCNWPAVRWKWIKFIQVKWAEFLAACPITPICVASTSVNAISQTPWNTAWGFASKLTWYSGTLSKSCLTGSNDTAVSLWVPWAKCQFRLRSSSWPFCSNSPEWHSRHMVTWFGRHGDTLGTTENVFFCAFITLRSHFHLHHRSQQSLTVIMSEITPNLGLVL